MRPHLPVPRLALLAAAASLAAACADEPPKLATRTPPGGPGAAAPSARAPLSPAARAALDSGNVEYRAGRWAVALAHYRGAAQASPASAAPYFGVYMAAQKLGNQALADSAQREIAKRVDTASGPGALTAHPTGTLPADAPAPLPAGHPKS